MKKSILLLAILAAAQVINISTVAAQSETPVFMARIYEDNDFINDCNRGTDDAYTNGTRIDLFYTKAQPSKLFLDRWMPKAGDSSINIFSIGVAEVMFTPSNILDIYYQPNDYSWAGGLYATHALYSYNPQKKYDIQTEVLAGVMGPDALARPVQQEVHRIIQDPSIPQGWDNQFNNDVLLNVNVTAEKQLAHIGNFVELIGSGAALAGTMTDAVDAGAVLIIGRMEPYFNGLAGQYGSGDKKRNRVQAYFKLKPGVQLVAWNSLLEGGMFSQQPLQRVPEVSAEDPVLHDAYVRQPRPEIENTVTYLSYSVVLVDGPVSLSFAQTHTSELVKNTYSHTYGNLSLYYTWAHNAKHS